MLYFTEITSTVFEMDDYTPILIFQGFNWF